MTARLVFWITLMYYSVAIVIMVSGSSFHMPQLFVSSLPAFLSVLLLIPIYWWQANYRKRHTLLKKIPEKSLHEIALRVLALFAIAMSVRIPSVLLFNQPYEKTPLIYLLLPVILLVERTELSAYGFKTERLGKAVVCGIMFFAFWGGSFLLSQYVMAYMFTGQLLLGHFDVVSSLSVLPFMVLCVGISEEGLFRGYAQTSLERVFKSRWAILTQSLLFGLWHFVWNLQPFNAVAMLSYVITTFAIGLSFGYFYTKTINLVPLVLAHGLWNSVMPWIVDNEHVAELLYSSSLLSQLMIFALPYIISFLVTFLFVKYFVKRI